MGQHATSPNVATNRKGWRPAIRFFAAGPFPAVVYMSGGGGIDPPPSRAQQKTTIDHMLAKGVAILIVDFFTPRNEPNGVCANLDGEKAIQYATREAAMTLWRRWPRSRRCPRSMRSISSSPASRSAAIRRCSQPIRRTPRAMTAQGSSRSRSRLDWRKRRLDTSREVGGHRQDQFRGHRLSRRYPCLQHAL